MNTKLLRQKILDLAIRGKLTEQKKSDGTTKDLLAQISKQWLVSSKQDSQKENASSDVILERTSNVIANTTSTSSRTPIRDPFAASKNSDDVIAGTAKQSKKKTFAPKEIIPLDKSEAPFEIPENWEWVRLGDVASDFQYGSSEKSSTEGKIAVLRMGNINRMGQVIYDDLVYTSTETEIQKYTLEVGDVLFNRTNSPEWVGKTALYKGEIPAIYAGYIIRIRPKFSPEYLNFLMCSNYEREWAYSVKTDGVHQSNINAQKLMNFKVPLPPLAEQQRIVTAIENAFAEITEIENNQELLKKHIKQGRQKILDLAIRGRLTQQLKTDGTTKDLLAQISKQWLVSSKQESQKENVSFNVIANTTSTSSRTPIRDLIAASKNSDNVIASTAKQSKKKTFAPKQIIPLDKSEAPFEIPENWEWVRLPDLCSIPITDGTHQTPTYTTKEEGIPFLSSKDVATQKIVWSQIRYITKDLHEELYKRIAPRRNDILLAKNGTTGVAALVETDIVFDIYVTLAVIRPYSQIYPQYLLWVINSPVAKKQFDESLKGTGVPNLHLLEINKTMIPLPPLAEQQRIVTTIEQSFAEFDAMEIDLK